MFVIDSVEERLQFKIGQMMVQQELYEKQIDDLKKQVEDLKAKQKEESDGEV